MSFRTVHASSVTRGTVRWLWPGWLPEGVLVTLDGDPAAGKSTVLCDLAARLSRGEWTGRPVSTLIVNGEEGVADTIVPRLMAAGADLNRVHLWDPNDPPTLPADVDELRKAIRESGARLLVIDPVSAFLGQELTINGDQAVRRAMMPLVRLAAETGCTILLVRHLRKQQGRAMYRGLGSIGIIGAARVGWLLGAHPRGRGLRVLTTTKMNLAPDPTPRVLSIADGRVTWHGEEAWLTAEAITGGRAEDAAGRWLDLVLAKGPKPATEVKAEAAAAGISERTLWRAKRDRAVAALKEGGIWYWCGSGR